MNQRSVEFRRPADAVGAAWFPPKPQACRHEAPCAHVTVPDVRLPSLPVLIGCLCSVGCVHAIPAAPVSRVARPVQLLLKTPERETARIPELRTDVEIDTRDFDRTPHVVATAETPMVELQDAAARLFGDAQGTTGFTVDNVLLIEVEDASGKVLDRAAVGFSDPVLVAGETIDNVGRRSFSFDPGEVDLTDKLPADRPFKLRVTALDYSGVGRVSDVFLVLQPRSGKSAHDDDLRAQ